MKPLEQLGRTAGWLVAAPIFAGAAALRRSRPLHPTGVLFDATCASAAPPEDLLALAEAVSGPALVRLSHALFKKPRPHVPDVLGCALRIDGEQDLLFATIKRPWTTLLAPLTTDVDHYFANHYYGVSPFVLAGVKRRFYLRLRPSGDGVHGAFALEASYRPRVGYREVARVTLDRVKPDAHDDQIRFDPFRNGRGIVPRGSIHAMRRGAYAASQTVRSLFSPA